MDTFIVTVHLPVVTGNSDLGMAVILTPTGKIEQRIISSETINSLDNPRDYAEDLLIRMFPARKLGMHGSSIEWQGPYLSSAHVVVVRVDFDELSKGKS